MKRRRDTATLDLFRDVKPAPVVARFEEEDVRAWSVEGRLSRAISKTLDACGRGREDVAEDMSKFLSERISKATLESYASQAKDTHRIPASRLMALVVVTGDARPLNALFEDAELIVVEQKYEALLRREKARELVDELTREADAADAEWRAKR